MRTRNSDLLTVAPLSMAFLTINVLLYALTAMRAADSNMTEVLLQFGASRPDLLWDGEWIRLIAPNFLHGGLLHIGFNGYYLYRMGPAAEVHFGSSNFGTLYLLSGVAGFCFSQIFGGHMAIGASAALCGIMGAYLAVSVLSLPRPTRALRNPAVREQLIWIGVLFLLGISGFMGRIDNWGHLGGLVFGTLLGGFFELWRTRRSLGISLVVLMLALNAGLICAARWTFFSPTYHIHMALHAAEAKNQAQMEAELAQAKRWAEVWHKQSQIAYASYLVRTGGLTRADVHRLGYDFILSQLKTLPTIGFDTPLPEPGEETEPAGELNETAKNAPEVLTPPEPPLPAPKRNPYPNQ